MVNRLWAHFFGRGIVEPVDDMDRPPLSEDLLDWLAADLADHKYDLKHTMRLICTSRAYGLASVGAPKPDTAGFTFRGPLVRRMSAEAFVDAVATLTEAWPGGASVKLPALDDVASAKTHRVRTALVNDDILTRALGLPNREQIVTRRDTIATTIQALESTNGATLDGMIKRGARTWFGRSGKDSKKLIEQLFQTAIGRRPTPEEHTAAVELVVSPATAEGIEDLLWVLAMLPEFQLVY